MWRRLLLLGLSWSQSRSQAARLDTQCRFQGREDANQSRPACRCFPGDSCWPLRAEWDQFNETLGGRLLATTPIASVCHKGKSQDGFGVAYDAAACEALRDAWERPQTHYSSSSSPMAQYFANMSCDPFQPPESPCVVGAYVRFAVNASSTSHVQTALDFARRRNIRLVIRNTGHDYLGKSTGAGALAIWTHNMKGARVVDYASDFYTGKAVEVMAGVLNAEAQAAAHAHGLVVAGGSSSSVGVAGGWTQGGGHGPLASLLGLGADQVLEWDVVTGTGRRLKATPRQNRDLYWALSGGGGGTYAVVASCTVRAYPDISVAAANMSFSDRGASSQTFLSAVGTFISNLAALTAANATCVWFLSSDSFSVSPIVAPGKTSEQLQALLRPTLDQLEHSGIQYEYSHGHYPTFLDSCRAIPALPVTDAMLGSRLMPRSLLSSNESMGALLRAMQFIVEQGAVLSGVSTNVGRRPAFRNSVNPAWRTTLFSAAIGVPYDSQRLQADAAAQDLITHRLIPRLAELLPLQAAYLNEGDFNEPNFQRVFYGQNYGRLLSIKTKYDPYNMFYGLTAVGSESWQTMPDGRLCMVCRD